MMFDSVCVETMKPVSEGDKNLTAVKENESVYCIVNPASRITGEGRAEFLRT